VPKLRYLTVANNVDGSQEIVATIDDDEGKSLISFRESGLATCSWTASLAPGIPPGGLQLPNYVGSIMANSDARLEYAVTNSSHHVWHTFQATPGGEWSDWGSLGAPDDQVISGPTLQITQGGRLQVFVLTSTGKIWTRRQTVASAGPWTAWASVGGPRPAASFPSAPPLAVLTLDGVIAVFAEYGGQVWFTRQTAPDADHWTRWAFAGSPGQHPLAPLDGFTVGQNANGELTVFAVSGDAIWRNRERGGAVAWEGWKLLAREAGSSYRDLASGSHLDGRMILAAVMHDSGGRDHLVTWEQDSGEGEDVPLSGGQKASGSTLPGLGISPLQHLSNPVIHILYDGRLRITTQAGDVALYYVTQRQAGSTEWFEAFERLI
jgi:hypothetical protein